jgi:general secretion pathway protein M
VVLLCLLLAAGYVLIVAPVLDFYHQREGTLADKRMLAQRLNAVAAELPGLRFQLAGLQAVASTRKIVLDGTSDAIASANLQSRLEELAAATGVAIVSTEAVAAENRGVYRRIGLRLAVGGEYAAIVKLLGAVDGATPPLILSNLQIHAVVRPRGDSPDARLDAGFEVYGFRNIEAPLVLQR